MIRFSKIMSLKGFRRTILSIEAFIWSRPWEAGRGWILFWRALRSINGLRSSIPRMIFQEPGQGIGLENGSIHVFQEASFKGPLPLRQGSISSSIPLPQTTRRIWSITLLSRSGSIYELESDNLRPCLSSLGGPGPSISWADVHPYPVRDDSEEIRPS